MNRRTLKWSVPLGGALLLLALAWSRPGRQDRGSPPRPRSLAAGNAARVPAFEAIVHTAPSAAAEGSSEPIRSDLSPWDAFRGALDTLSGSRERLGAGGYRTAVLEETARFLEFDRSTAEAFGSVEQVVEAELRGIERGMAGVFAVYPVDLPDAELQRIQTEVEGRFGPEKQAAFARLEAFLDEKERHRQFRGFLETWTAELLSTNP